MELTPATLVPVLPESEEGDEKRNAHLEGLRALAGDGVRSTRLAVMPVWVGELTRLEALEVSGVKYIAAIARNTLLKSLPALQARDVLAIGRALKAWPLPLLHDVDFYDVDIYDDNDDEEKMRLSTCWRALGLPAEAADWTNAMTLDYLRVQQQKVAAFAAWCGVGRVVAGRAGAGDDCG